MKKLILLVLSMGLVACGSNPQKVAAVKVGDEYYKPDNSAAMAIDNKTGERIVCERRIVTGSNRKQKSCTTESQKKQERRAAQETINSNESLTTRRIIDSKGGG